MRDRDIKFKKLSAWVPGMIYQFTKRPDGTYCLPFATEAIRDLYGCSPQDVREDFSPIVRAIFPDDLDKIFGSIKYATKHVTNWTCEYRVQIPGQPIQWTLGNSAPEKLADGSIIWYGFNADITNHKRAEEKLCQSEEKYRSIFENAQEGIYRTTPEGRFDMANQAMARILGYDSPNELMDSMRPISPINSISIQRTAQRSWN